MSAWLGVAGFALSLLVSIISVTAMVITMKNNIARLNEKDQEHKDREAKREKDEDEAADQVREMFVLLKEFIARQTEINKVVEMGLTGVINQLRDMEKRTVESSTVVSLLTEVLKKAEIKGIQVAP